MTSTPEKIHKAQTDLVTKMEGLMFGCDGMMNGEDAIGAGPDYDRDYGLVIVGFTNLGDGVVHAAVTNGVPDDILIKALETWIVALKQTAGMGANDNVH
jgi:hypothetical protein